MLPVLAAHGLGRFWIDDVGHHRPGAIYTMHDGVGATCGWTLEVIGIIIVVNRLRKGSAAVTSRLEHTNLTTTNLEQACRYFELLSSDQRDDMESTEALH